MYQVTDPGGNGRHASDERDAGLPSGWEDSPGTPNVEPETAPALQALSAVGAPPAGEAPVRTAVSGEIVDDEPRGGREVSQPDRRRGLAGLVFGRISVKIVGPYLIVMLVLAALATFVTLRLMTDQLTKHFQGQLVDDGQAANNTVLKIEQEQIDLLHLMAATDGVDTAIVNKDVATLQKLLIPLEANSQYNIVDVVNASGQEVLALRPNSGPLARAVDPDIGQWTITQETSQGKTDQFGDKYSDLVATSFGRMLYTSSPVRDSNGKVVGAILVGLPFNDLLARLTKAVVANITIYGPDGHAIGTTLGTSIADPALTVDVKTFQRATDPKAQLSVQRPLRVANVDYLELLGQLYVGHDRVVAALAVDLPTPAIAQANAQTQRQMTALFVVVVFIVLIVGFLLARSITQPIMMLVRACKLVAGGDLEQQVPAKTRDETGVLARTFNHMVSGLKERDFLKDTFGRYTSKALSDAILSGELSLGGERRDVTMLSSDIRSFTTLSETMAPEDLVAFLNRYFHAMVDCVIRYGGTVDKFIGDAIVAVFGVPIQHEDDARRAMMAALQMRQRMKEFNEFLESEGKKPIRIGIGLHTGPVVAGNIGSEVRMDYTCVGDTVDIADGTQLLTKDFKTDILISSETYELIKDYFDFAPPNIVESHGEETAIYGVIGLKDIYQEMISDDGPVLVAADEAPMTQEMIDAQLAGVT